MYVTKIDEVTNCKTTTLLIKIRKLHLFLRCNHADFFRLQRQVPPYCYIFINILQDVFICTTFKKRTPFWEIKRKKPVREVFKIIQFTSPCFPWVSLLVVHTPFYPRTTFLHKHCQQLSAGGKIGRNTNAMTLTISQTTTFRLYQIERVCR